MLKQTRKNERMSWLAPTGVLDFKYYPCIPLYGHMVSCYTNEQELLRAEGGFLHSSLITSKFFFYFHFYTCLSLPPPLSSFLFPSFSSFHSPAICTPRRSVCHVPTVSLLLYTCASDRQKLTMLECMCSRSGDDCATAEMSP